MHEHVLNPARLLDPPSFLRRAYVKLTTTRLLAHCGFSLATMALLTMVWLDYDVTNNAFESFLRVSHSQEALQESQSIDEAISRAEAAQRGYLHLGADNQLLERDQAIEKANVAVARLTVLTTGNPVQQQRIRKLESLIAARVSLMKENSILRGAQDIGDTEARGIAGVGTQARARIDDVTAELRQEEGRVLAVRRLDASRRHDDDLGILLGADLTGLLILVLCYIGFILQARSRDRSENKLRHMADSLPGAMYQLLHPLRGTPRFTFMSAGLASVRNIQQAGALPGYGQWVNGIDERDQPGFLAAVAEARSSLEPLHHDYRVKLGDGTVRWLHSEATMQKEADGSVLMNGYVADITGQQRLKDGLHDAVEAANMANRAKSTFLATMSHEIRTPMNGVLGMLELLTLTKLTTEQQTTLAIVRESNKSLLRIIDDILDFSKIEAGKLDVRPEAASIKDVIEDVHNIYSGNASSKGLLIKRIADPNISPAVLVDPMRLRQILNNFVSNALKFTAKGSIEIRAELLERTPSENRVRFSVKDTGIGVSPENQQLLFLPFNQIDGARQVGGTGLGLVICRRLAEMMGGSVHMESEVGKGTTMALMLSLPIADPNDIPAVDLENVRVLLSTTTRLRRMAPTIEEAEAEGTLVLIVDDHPTNRSLLLRQVHAIGYAAETADNGAEAFLKWKTGRFGLLITDCHMPEMDGYDLTRSIRMLESENLVKRKPILAFTANALSGEAEVCFDAGMDDCLFKPVSLTQILVKLDQWLPIPESIEMPPPIHGKSPVKGTLSLPVNRSVLAEISGGNVAIERDILIDFKRINDEDAVTFKRAVARNDIPQITLASHRICGASKIVGAMDLAEVCRRIELASRAGNMAAVLADMGPFHDEWKRVNSYFDTI